MKIKLILFLFLFFYFVTSIEGNNDYDISSITETDSSLSECFEYGEDNCNKDCDCIWCNSKVCVPGDINGPIYGTCNYYEYVCNKETSGIVRVSIIGILIFSFVTFVMFVVGYFCYKNKQKHIVYDKAVFENENHENINDSTLINSIRDYNTIQ
eukprot:TRINITY_DN7573_c2_g1_i2.p1 TRINITY_DN7573_c2_g1~~TRINITY_DN7573_c2_g1_i2.p1  ORF type:complete len:154 (+),score=12.14 TRINITY_DN7573_c2_g1_i2:141-602(+)